MYRSFAVIEFEIDGTIRHANENFLQAMGYSQEQIAGKHHRMFVDTEYARSESYAGFWARLAKGEFFSDRVKRIDGRGQIVWLQATYNPVIDRTGSTTHVVKFATDITNDVEAEERLKEGVRVMLGMISNSSGLATDISSASDQLAATAQSQSDRAAEMSGASERIREAISQTADYGDEVNRQAESSGQLANNGSGLVRETIERIRTLSQSIQTASQTVLRLHESGNQISAIIAVIEDIAETTHLLALNAAIEAARAGDRGDGFAVVAREIRNLSERTRQATSKISDRIQSLQADTTEVVEIMRESGEAMEATTTHADQAGSALQDIVSASAATVEMNRRISELLLEQSEEAQALTERVSIVSSSAHESANATRQIAQSASGLNSVSQALREEVLGLQPTGMRSEMAISETT